MITISFDLSNLPNQAINEVIWLSYLKWHEKMLLRDTHIIWFEQPTKSGNIWGHVTIISEITSKNATWWYPYHPIWATYQIRQYMRSCDHHIWNCIEKCCLMIPISSHLTNLPNPVIYEVMWPSYLKSHRKMLPDNTHIILFEQPTKSGNIWGHVTIISEITSKKAA